MKPPAREPFAVRLFTLMARDGYSTTQLARYTAITPSSLYAYQRGQFHPGYRELIKLAQVFNTSIDYLCGLKESP
jgi:transcriptional regulator with XRE-family HTH domain